MKLAAWCEEKGSRIRRWPTTRGDHLDPSREAAWKHLGYKKQGHRWVKPEEVAAAKQEALHQKNADKHWKTKLEKLREGLASKDAAKRESRTRADGGHRPTRGTDDLGAVRAR